MQDDQMIEIKAYDLHWLNRVEDNPNDLCAHGSVAITIDEQRFVPEDEYCVSAAAVYLLRTLDEGYEKSDQDEQLIPHCGHSMFEVENSDDVMIIGCPHGYDFLVQRVGEMVRLEFEDGEVFQVSSSDWEKAVCAFSDSVEKLYDDSAAKEPSDEVSQAGYDAFRGEWKRRREMFRQ